jgi:thiosulfate/3-mercaptopyruvate sulfurtransferase
MESLVSTQWLADEMGACDLRIVEATKHMPDAGRNARAEFEEGHIPGAVFLDLANLVDPAAQVENTLPSAEAFAARMEKLGIGDGSRVVLYDDSKIKSAARAWFMMRLFGAQNVAILDGGLAKWIAEGRPVASAIEQRRPRHFTPWSDRSHLRAKTDVLGNLSTRSEQLVDARATPRFTGASPETRPGLASGHIPGSRNIPYTALFNADGTFKDAAALRDAFVRGGVDLDRPVITTCGSGMTACVLAFGMHLIGKDDVSLYDGSWSEWGADPATPKEVGEAIHA